MGKKILLLGLMILLLSAKSYGHFTMTPALQNAHSQLLELRIFSAQKIIQEEKNKQPDNSLCYYLESYLMVTKILLEDDKNLYEKLAKNEDYFLEKIAEDSNKNSPYYAFVRAEIKLQWAFVKTKFGDEISAAWSMRQAYKLLAENTQKFPDFLPQRKSLGMLQILIGSVPQQYTWIVHTAGLYGDIKTGMANMKAASRLPDNFGEEAQLLMALVQVYILHQPQEAIATLAAKYKANPSNLLVCFLYGTVLCKNAQSEAALPVFLNYPKGADYGHLLLISYMLGEIFLQKSQYEKAITYYDFFVKKHKGINYKKDAHYKIFLAYWLQNKSKEAQIYFDKIRTEGRRTVEADRYAAQVYEQGAWPNPVLMRVRLATDGGYYEQAHEALKQLNTNILSNNKKDLVEYFYRSARLHHQTRDTAQAIYFYKQTIEQGKDLPYYFAANSALQLGYLYQEQGNMAAACQYFERTLTFRKHEYKNSLDNKAKAAISGLNCR